MKPLTDKKLLVEIYKTLVEQDQFYVDLFERRIIFFSGLVTAIVTGLVGIYFYLQTNYFIVLVGE